MDVPERRAVHLEVGLGSEGLQLQARQRHGFDVDSRIAGVVDLRGAWAPGLELPMLRGLDPGSPDVLVEKVLAYGADGT